MIGLPHPYGGSRSVDEASRRPVAAVDHDTHTLLCARRCSQEILREISRLQQQIQQQQQASDEPDPAFGGTHEGRGPWEEAGAGGPTKRKKSLDDMLEERAAVLLLESPRQVCVRCVQKVRGGGLCLREVGRGRERGRRRAASQRFRGWVSC